MGSYNDKPKAVTAEDLMRRYNLEEINRSKKAITTLNDNLTKTNANLEKYVEKVLEDISNLQDQVDGNISTWFFSGIPTLENSPAVDWTTEEEKANHLGDLYYDKDTGYAYRFSLGNNVYSWLKLTDSDITEALALANAAQDTADSKRRVFVTTPTPPYDVGDIWFKDNADLYRCRASRSSGEYSEVDWIIATKYTDDTYAMNVKAVLDQFKETVETNYATKVALETTAESINTSVSTVTTKVTTLEGKVDDTVASIVSEYKIQGSSDDWSTAFPNRQEGQVVLRRNKITYVDGTYEYSAEEEITGDPGDAGPQGPQGEPGEQGIQGLPGNDGTSSYFYVRYSANADGNPMTTTPTDDSKYMGVASTTSATAPTLNTDYTWSLIKGADGQNGTPGAPGENGQTSYLHIKYSEDGETFTPADDTYAEGEKPSAYIGQYVDFTPADSTIFDDYNWYKFTEDIDPTLTNLQNQIDNNAAVANNNYQDTLNKINGLATVESVTQVTQAVETLTTSTEHSINVINETITNGVPTLKTNKGYTFSDDGLDIDETNSPTKFNADTDGITVTDKTGNTESELLFAGYDLDLMQSIVRTANLLVRTYLMIGNNHPGGDWRIEIVEDDSRGLGIGFFYMGDD